MGVSTLNFSDLETALADGDRSLVCRTIESLSRDHPVLEHFELGRSVIWMRCLRAPGPDPAIPERFFVFLNGRFLDLGCLGGMEDCLYHHLIRDQCLYDLESREGGSRIKVYREVVRQVSQSCNRIQKDWFLTCVDIHLVFLKLKCFEDASAVLVELRKIADALDDADISDAEFDAEATAVSMRGIEGHPWSSEETDCIRRLRSAYEDGSMRHASQLIKGLSRKLSSCAARDEQSAVFDLWSELLSLQDEMQEHGRDRYWIYSAGQMGARMCGRLRLWKGVLFIMRDLRRMNLQNDPDDICARCYLEVLQIICEIAGPLGKRIQLDNEIYGGATFGSVKVNAKQAFLKTMQTAASHGCLSDGLRRPDQT